MHQPDILHLVDRRFGWPGPGCHLWHPTYRLSGVLPSVKVFFFYFLIFNFKNSIKMSHTLLTLFSGYFFLMLINFNYSCTNTLKLKDILTQHVCEPFAKIQNTATFYIKIPYID